MVDFTSSSIISRIPSMVATVLNNHSLFFDSIYCMALTQSTLVVSLTFGAPNPHMEENFGRSMGASMDNGCRSNPLPSNGNLGKASFNNIVKNVSHSPHLLA
jgi:hypothetical protein